MIDARSLSFAYPEGACVFQGLTFRVEAGERVALLGPNGAGKSTFLLHLNGLLKGTGQLQVADLPVTPSNLAEIRAKVGLVFQDPDDQLFCPTLNEDVAYGPLYMGLHPDEVKCRVGEALRAVGLQEQGERPPSHLSGGQKKRAALATVLSMRPQLLVLDEPTAGLDARSRRALIEALRDWSGTLLVATHDLPLAEELCRRVLVLDEGRLVADGLGQNILGDRELLVRHGLVA